MRLFAYVAIVVAGVGCSEADPLAAPEEPAPAEPTVPTAIPSFGEVAVARARAWVDAEVPYCGGPNGGQDIICGGTCRRDGPSNRSDWDDYRSDCSGFVSWSWGLPAPGRTTRSLAPYDDEVSVVIDVDELRAGDALNGDGHVMLFDGWIESAASNGTRRARILEQARCGQTARETIAAFEVVDSTHLEIKDGRVFRPIRLRDAR